MEKAKNDYGETNISCENVNESLEGSHSCMLGLISSVVALENDGFIITKINCDIEFREMNSTETPIVTEEREIISDGDSISVEVDMNTVSIAKRLAGFTSPAEFKLASILEKYAKKGRMGDKSWKEFSEEFIEAFEDCYTLDAEEQENIRIYEDMGRIPYHDLNMLLRDHNLNYRARAIDGVLESQYRINWLSDN